MLSSIGTRVKLVLLMDFPKSGLLIEPIENLLELYAERLSAACSWIFSSATASGVTTFHL
jgi:hypothetical protein